MLSHFSCIQLFATLQTGVRQAPLSMGFSRQEHWNGLPCPPPGDLPNPGIELVSPASPAMQMDSLLLNHQGSPHILFSYLFYIYIAPVCMYVCVCIYIYIYANPKLPIHTTFPPPLGIHTLVLYICVSYFCFANKFICIIFLDST